MATQTTAVGAAFDPSAPLLTFLRGAFGADVRYAEPPASFGQGFDTLIYGFQIEGAAVGDVWARPLVLRVYTTPQQDDKARREAAIQRYVAERGYPALPPLAVETSDGLLGLPYAILERMPGGSLVERLTKRPWRGRRLVHSMGQLHAALHRLPFDEAPAPRHCTPSIDMHLAGLRLMTAASRITGLDGAMAWLERNADAAGDEQPALLHGDFHPLNILFAGDDTMRVIDWSDARIGDRHADVARTATLIWFAQIVATSAAERVLAKAVRGWLRRGYLAGYRSALPLDLRRLAYWEAAHVIRGVVQIMQVHAPGQDDLLDLAARLPRSLIPEARAYFNAKVKEFRSISRTTTA